MSSTPREIGTLIVVILKAKNLPNKRHIGKQAPYCSLTLAKETRRTKPIKKGGQHPEWDEEVRFSLLEDTEDVLARTASVDGDDAPPVPSKKSGKDRYLGKSLRLACYADDARDPEFIGEVKVDLTEALTKGEVDEWFTLLNKDKYSGEVYLEMTFWSNEQAPVKKAAPRVSTSNPQYGGPGEVSDRPSHVSDRPSRVSDIGIPDSLRAPSGNQKRTSHSPEYQSAADLMPDLPSRRPELPDSLKPSDSLAKLELYSPLYDTRREPETPRQTYSTPRPAYDEFGASRRRESFPPLSDSRQYSSSSSHSRLSESHEYDYGPSPSTSLSSNLSALSLSSASSYSRPLPQVTGDAPYFAPPSGFYQPGPSPQSTGFVPPQPSSTPFLQQQTGVSNYAPPLPSHTPGPSAFGFPAQAPYNSGPSPAPSNIYSPQSAPTPAPSSSFSPQYPPQPSHTPFQLPPGPISFPTYQSVQSSLYPPPPSSAPPFQTQCTGQDSGQTPTFQNGGFSSYSTTQQNLYPSTSPSSSFLSSPQGGPGATSPQGYSPLSPPQSAPPLQQHIPINNNPGFAAPSPPRPHSSSTAASRPLPAPQQHSHAHSQPNMQPAQSFSNTLNPLPPTSPPPPPPPSFFPQSTQTQFQAPPPPPPLHTNQGSSFIPPPPPPPRTGVSPAPPPPPPSLYQDNNYNANHNYNHNNNQYQQVPPPPPPPLKLASHQPTSGFVQHNQFASPPPPPPQTNGNGYQYDSLPRPPQQQQQQQQQQRWS